MGIWLKSTVFVGCLVLAGCAQAPPEPVAADPVPLEIVDPFKVQAHPADDYARARHAYVPDTSQTDRMREQQLAEDQTRATQDIAREMAETNTTLRRQQATRR